jgi:hypothetical protein
METITTTSAEQIAFRPEFFRLPRPGEGDVHFGFSRSFYYEADRRGYFKLIRIVDGSRGRTRGVTLVRFKDVLDFVNSQAAKQQEATP